jgi:mannitol-1-phosphate 5-dehydrogenase
VSLSGKRTFVGFGFGAIQAGLFLCEAFRSGNFRRLIVAEVMPNAVQALRQSAGKYAVNVAYHERVEAVEIGPTEIANPANQSECKFLVAAVAEAAEIATALPSVAYYTSASPGSVHRILADGLRRKAAAGGPPAVVYAAENHNHAAEILEEAVLSEIPRSEHDQVHARVSFLNTVIGKMSGVVTDPNEIEKQGLKTVTPFESRAVLVEAFNRILVSRTSFGGRPAIRGFRRGIEVFEEKPDLLPFEEAKLYGHNSTHAVAAYLGALLGVGRIADLERTPGVAAFLEAAFVNESGEALIRRHKGKDPLFTPEGYQAYATDLLLRMFNPYLGDTVERVGRDPERKLEWDDRLVGTVRLALQQGLNPVRYAMGTAAAVATLDKSALDSNLPLQELLDPLWHKASPNPAEREVVLRAVEEGRTRLRLWRQDGFPNLEAFVEQSLSIPRRF